MRFSLWGREAYTQRLAVAEVLSPSRTSNSHRQPRLFETILRRCAVVPVAMHFDDLNRIRVLDEDTSSQAQELKEVCQDFLGDIGDFQVGCH